MILNKWLDQSSLESQDEFTHNCFKLFYLITRNFLPFVDEVPKFYFIQLEYSILVSLSYS